ncbi:cytochrome P450 [Earliella scabrosa]|nr:cytochrome P450 [Earliella scabrosa]
MSMSASTSLPFLGLALLIGWLLLRDYVWRRRLQLPPGPKPCLVLGNVLDMPRTHLGREFQEMSRKFGDLVYLDFLGQPMMIVGSYKVAHELLDRRSANYSSRPTSVMIRLAGLSFISVLKEYGSEWRQHRRLLHQWFNSEVVVQHRPVQLKITRNFLRGVLKSPSDLYSQLKFSFAATTLLLAYGIEVVEPDNEYYHMVERISAIGEELTVPGRYAVDAIPVLERLPSWFPGAGFKKYAAEAKREISAIVDRLHDAAKVVMTSGVGKQSVTGKSLDKAKCLDAAAASEVERVCKQVTATIYSAGSDTTNSAMQAFFLAMALYPEIQKKAQQQLDQVVGGRRLPDFSDQHDLPYVNALVKELLRWHCVTPIGVPHSTIADDQYNGYFIPAGSIVTPNIWAMSRDPETFPEPEEFKPERFLNQNGQLDMSGTVDPINFVFGFGRRICPGRHFAEASLFILCASALHAFDIRPPVDENGHPVRIIYTMRADTVVSHAGMHEYIIKPRSLQAERLVLDTSDLS